MGCWNGTCGISQLPITVGTKVKTVILLQSSFNNDIIGSGTCYSSEYFRPWFFPVTAEYNDYGSIENIEMDWNAQYMFNTFRKWLAEGRVKILEDDECEINSPDITEFTKLEDVFDCIERGALIYNHCDKKFDIKSKKWVSVNKTLKIAMFMVLIPVWNSLVKECKRYVNLKKNGYWKKRCDEYKTKAFESITKARKKSGSEKEMDELDGCIFDMHVDRLLGDLIDEHVAFKHYKTILYDPDIISIEKFFKKLDEINAISTSMEILRKYWISQTGNGSQNEELSFHKALIEGMNKHIDKREKQIEEYKI